MVMFIVIYSGAQSLQKEEIKSGYGILIVGFSLILFYLFRKLLRNKKIDYSAPTITFLKNAEKRYRFMPFLDVVITIPLLALLITGGGIIVKESFTRYFPGSFLPLVIYLIFMAGVVAFGFWASYRNWLRDKGEILEEIRKMRKEFEEA
jgi:phosphoglycerol transferase MdoB-like AlkP superfamily enzyme